MGGFPIRRKAGQEQILERVQGDPEDDVMVRKIGRVEGILLDDIPITPPPFRPGPSRAGVVVLEIETDDGMVGYGITPGPVWPMTTFVNGTLADFLRGRDPMLAENIWLEMTRKFGSADGGIWASA